MQYSELKKIKAFCGGLFSSPDWREVVQNALDEKPDFEVDNVRFISGDEIDKIQRRELKEDEYILGSFRAWLLADILEIDQDAVEAMQRARAFEALGKLVKSMGKLGELQQAYASTDGYGHHFNRWDFSEEEIRINGTLYHVFDNH